MTPRQRGAHDREALDPSTGRGFRLFVRRWAGEGASGLLATDHRHLARRATRALALQLQVLERALVLLPVLVLVLVIAIVIAIVRGLGLALALALGREGGQDAPASDWA